MALRPRLLAGPGLQDTVMEVFTRAGWSITHDDEANAYAFSADRRLVVTCLSTPAVDGSGWTIRCAYSDQDDARLAWEATFTAGTPTEFIAAFAAELVKPDPFDRADDTPGPADIT